MRQRDCFCSINVSTCQQGQWYSHRKREGGVREAAAAALQGADIERSVQLSCGEHTDYGLLTLVNQDSHVSALQVQCNLVLLLFVTHTGATIDTNRNIEGVR